MTVHAAWWVWAASGAVFAGLLAVVLLAAAAVFAPAGSRRLAALDDYLGLAAGGARRAAGNASPSAVTEHLLQISSRAIKGRAATARAAQLLERADLPIRSNEWYVLRALAVFLGAVVVAFVLRGSTVGVVLGVLAGAVLGVVAPAVFLSKAAKIRARRFERQLPDTLTLVASSLASGFSLPQALDAIVTDAPEPTAKEFARALAETRIGADLEDSLDHMATRMASTNMAWTTMAIRIQRSVGGNLAETLRTTASTLRDRESLLRQVQALSAEGRLSAYILIALPVGIFFYMLGINRPYVALLWQNPLGWAMSAAGLLSLAIGVFWMRRTVNVEV